VDAFNVTFTVIRSLSFGNVHSTLTLLTAFSVVVVGRTSQLPLVQFFQQIIEDALNEVTNHQQQFACF
jgi:hypothetical protein